MKVAPFFVDFHHFLSIFTIFYRFSRFTHFCRDLHFVAIYILSRFTHFFRNFFFGQNSLLRNITRFLHVCIARIGHLSTDIFITKMFVWRKGLVSIQVKLTALLAVHVWGLSLHDWHIKLPLWLPPVHIYCAPVHILPHLFANNAHTLLKPGPCSSILPHSYADNVPTLLKLYPLLTYIANINLQRMPLTVLKLLLVLDKASEAKVLAQ